jgi:peptide chain release factor 1
MGIMRSKLYELEREKKLNETGDIRKNAIKGGDRSDKIKTYNFPQSRLTDHRIKKSWFNLDQILAGDIDEILSEKII